MRVTLVTETYFPQVNGVSRTLGQLVRHLREAGDDVQVVQPDYGEPTDPSRTIHPASDRSPCRSTRSCTCPCPRSAAHAAIDEFRPDLVHIATEATLGLSAPAARARPRASRSCRASTRISISTATTTGSAGPTGRSGATSAGSTTRRARRTSPRARRSPSWRAAGSSGSCSGRGGWTAACSAPIGRGGARSGEALGFAPEDVVIGHVSRIAVEKNVGFLGRGTRLVAAARPEVRFLFVGDGPARADVERPAGPDGAVRRLRAGEDLADHYAAADLFAFASLTETFGNVILEAMASGLPVVAVRAGGSGDIVQPGVTGALIDPDAPPSRFADALIRLVDDRDDVGACPRRPGVCPLPDLGRDHGRAPRALSVNPRRCVDLTTRVVHAPLSRRTTWDTSSCSAIRSSTMRRTCGAGLR